MATSVERILHFIEAESLSKREFYDKCGMSNGSLNNIKHLGGENMEKILNAYPQINAEWLITGKGAMLKTDSKESTTPTEPSKKFLEERMKEMEEWKAKVQKAFPDVKEIQEPLKGKGKSFVKGLRDSDTEFQENELNKLNENK